MARLLRVRYEKGVLKPLEPLDIAEGKVLLVKIIDAEEKRKSLERYRGALGRVDESLLEEALEEAEHA